MPGGIDISEDTLEDELACNDIFLDYFNAFLSLPGNLMRSRTLCTKEFQMNFKALLITLVVLLVTSSGLYVLSPGSNLWFSVFPQPLYYNRLTGTFVEVEGTVNTLSGTLLRPSTPLYGATDDQRQRMLSWASNERLPTFLRSQLYREFKLCKFLLRPLSDEATRHNSAIRGYSRQTESYVSSLSNSAVNSANEDDFQVGTDFSWADFSTSNIYIYPRPLSKARSLPPHLGIGRTYVASGSTLTRDNLTSKQTTNNSNCKQHASAGSKSTRDKQQAIMIPILPSEVSEVPPMSVAPSNIQDTLRPIDESENGVKIDPANPDQAEVKFPANPEENQYDEHLDNQEEREGLQTPAAPINIEVDDHDLTFVEDGEDLEVGGLVSFHGDLISEAQTEADVRHLEGKLKMTLQRMKEKVLSSVKGMAEFKNFLEGTNGIHLVHFWLDCEEFKDTMGDFDDDINMAKRNQFFRDIKDRYRLHLTQEAKKQTQNGALHLSHTVFIRTQYDVLRRLRAYWLPRFLIHKERKNELREFFNKNEVSFSSEWPMTALKSNSGLFPSISLVNSMPCKPEDVLQIAMTTSWDMVSKGGRKLDDRIKSAKPLVRQPATHQSLEEKLVLTLSADKISGGPFQLFLARHKDKEHEVLQSNLSFWEDVTEYGVAQDRFADRLLRMHHAWTIFNQYLSLNCPQPIGINQKLRDDIHRLLLTTSDFVEATIFQKVKEVAIKMLEKSWIRYLKEDMKSFLDHCHISRPESRPGTAEEIEVILDEVHQRLVVRPTRPWVRRYPPSTDSERGQRLRTALSMADSIYEEKRAEQRAKAKEKRKEMEKERRKAIKAARKRQKEARMLQNAPAQPPEEELDDKPEEGKEEGKKEEEEDDDDDDEDDTPDFYTSAANRGIVALFKKYLTENEGRDATNMVNLYMDIEAHNNIAQADKKTKIKKEAQASIIFKTYMEQGAKKKVLLSDKVYNRLKVEKNRPRSSTMKDVQHHLLPKIEEHFKKFWEKQSQEAGGENNNLAKMSKAEMAMKTEDDPGLLTTWKKKGKARKKAIKRHMMLMETWNDDRFMSTWERKSKKNSATEGRYSKTAQPPGRHQPNYTNTDDEEANKSERQESIQSWKSSMRTGTSRTTTGTDDDDEPLNSNNNANNRSSRVKNKPRNKQTFQSPKKTTGRQLESERTFYDLKDIPEWNPSWGITRIKITSKKDARKQAVIRFNQTSFNQQTIHQTGHNKSSKASSAFSRSKTRQTASETSGCHYMDSMTSDEDNNQHKYTTSQQKARIKASKRQRRPKLAEPSSSSSENEMSQTDARQIYQQVILRKKFAKQRQVKLEKFKRILQSESGKDNENDMLVTTYKMIRQYEKLEASQSAAAAAANTNWDGEETTPQKKQPIKRRTNYKSTGIARPTSQDQQEFVVALSEAAAGHLPPQMLHFYLHLVKYGEEGECPLADKDLVFYCEVLKFKAAHHAYADDDMLKRKVQALLDCFLDTSNQPPLQIDIKSEVQQRTVRAARRYLEGKDVSSTIFDEAMYQVFKELLPFWSGFMKIYEPPVEQFKKPMTMKQLEREERLDDLLRAKPPSAKKLTLPVLPKGTTLASVTVSLTEGIKWKEGISSESEVDTGRLTATGRRSNLSKRKSSSLRSIVEPSAIAAT